MARGVVLRLVREGRKGKGGNGKRIRERETWGMLRMAIVGPILSIGEIGGRGRCDRFILPKDRDISKRGAIRDSSRDIRWRIRMLVMIEMTGTSWKSRFLLL